MIAIIAILAAILLPALSKARDKAKDIGCMNNQKQLFSGMTQYIDSNNGIIPAADFNLRNDLHTTWLDVIYFMLKPGNHTWPTIETIYVQQVGKSNWDCIGITRCPAQQPRGARYSAYASHYGINNYTDSWGVTKPKQFKAALDRVRHPSQRMFFGDCDRGIKDGEIIQWWGPDCGRKLDINANASIPRWRHLNRSGGNYTFVDGHVKALSALQIPENYWCSQEGATFWYSGEWGDL